MKLSELVYLAVKNVIYYDDDSFTYAEFQKGTFRNSPDYAKNIHNVYSPLNEAISRLSDLDRIPYKIEEFNQVTDSIIDVSDLNAKEIISVANVFGAKIEFIPYGINKIKIGGCITDDIAVEYKEDIPMFNELSQDVNLKIYGITDGMCNYIIEYVEGKLLEPVDPNIANMHITRAEQYFVNINPVRSAFEQSKVYKVHNIGD